MATSSCTAPRLSQGCARRARSPREALDLLVERVQARRVDRRARQVRLRFRARPRRLSRAAQLSRLPQVDLHLDQSRRLPRHSRRQAAARRRHPQHRRDADRRRLARRREPHVCRRRAAAARAAADRRDLRVPAARHRRGQAGRDDRRHRLRHPELRREASAARWCATSAATGSAGCSTTSRTFSMSAGAAKACRCAPACSSPSSR